MFDKIQDLWAEKKTRQIIVLGVLGLVVVLIALSMTDDTSSQLKQIERMQAPTGRDGSFFGTAPSLQQISDRDAQSMVDQMTRDMQTRERELANRESAIQRQNEQIAQRQSELETVRPQHSKRLCNHHNRHMTGKGKRKSLHKTLRA